MQFLFLLNITKYCTQSSNSNDYEREHDCIQFTQQVDNKAWIKTEQVWKHIYIIKENGKEHYGTNESKRREPNNRLRRDRDERKFSVTLSTWNWHWKCCTHRVCNGYIIHSDPWSTQSFIRDTVYARVTTYGAVKKEFS